MVIFMGKNLSKDAIAVYVEFFRGSPLFVQLFIAVYTVPAILNLQIDHYFLAFLVFGLNSAGYQKGYIKGAMETVSWTTKWMPVSQRECQKSKRFVM